MATSRVPPTADRATVEALRRVLREIEEMTQGYQMATVTLDRIATLARKALEATE